MRRAMGGLLALVLMAPALAVSAGSSHGEYRDDFKEISYSGNDGSLSWSGGWYDSEDQDPWAGVIHVDDGICEGNKCLHIDSEGELVDHYIKRKADMSVFSFSELCFEMNIDNEGQVDAAFLSVDISPDGGSNWVQLALYPILTSGGYHKVIKDLSDFSSPNTYLRFRITGVLESAIYIDNVEIKGELDQGTTTTSSTSTSTSTSSTTTTTQATTTSTSSTTTTQPTTTTSAPATTSTTTGPTTTSTVASSTTTTSGAGLVSPPGIPPPDSGIRDPGAGLMADVGVDMIGDMSMDEVEVLGAEVTADFSMAVEAFESAKVWIAGLALMITAAIVSGMDSRRLRNQKS